MRRRAGRGIAMITVCAACITGSDPALFINFDTFPPDTTSETQIFVSGEVVRVPPRVNSVKTLTVTGGASTVSVTADDFGLWEIIIPLRRNTTNLLVFVATDDTGAQRSSRIQWEVVQESVQ